MTIRPAFTIIAGALLVAAIGISGGAARDQILAQRLSEQADAAIAQLGIPDVSVRFTNNRGWPTRHPLLSVREDLDEASRLEIAHLVAGVPGVGGVIWADGTMVAEGDAEIFAPMHCQDDVEALLRARTIRFEESSTNLDAASRELLDEVAASLRPCLGSIIAVTGHTDRSGPEPGNLAISRERASAVRQALIARGIPADGLRARGIGSSEPVDGLAASDPANRRIDFSVIATVPLAPTPVDTPSAR